MTGESARVHGGEGSTGRALVIHPVFRQEGRVDRDPGRELEEIVGLAVAIDLDVAHAESIRVAKVRPATLLGVGIVDRLREACEALEITIVVVNAALTPVQQRNLEQALKAKVIDRTGLILEIFGARARTHEGRLQVELAALTYQRSRLVRSWTHLERQRGGFGFMGGPGESQLEIDRRLTDQRIATIKRQLEGVKRTRALHRKARQDVPYPVIALVGYTNAGKSTLFNRLTNSKVFAKELLFATLDPTMRRIELPSGRRAILSDTVGFISDLPTDLVAAFRATLEEVQEADIVVHVRDAATDDFLAQKKDVDSVLDTLGVGTDPPPLEALNKIDLLNPEQRRTLAAQAARNEQTIMISAATGEGTPALLEALDGRLRAGRETCRFDIALSDGAAIAWLYDHGEVLDRTDDTERAHVTVALDPEDAARFESRFGAAWRPDEGKSSGPGE